MLKSKNSIRKYVNLPVRAELSKSAIQVITKETILSSIIYERDLLITVFNFLFPDYLII
jgi:hypothetical protein